jgi:HAD superfamily hydrolase (TIGR01509 family)
VNVPVKRPACVLFDLDETLVRYDHDARVRTLAARVGVAPERIEAELFASGLEHDSDLGRHDARGQAEVLARRLGVAVSLADCIAARAASMAPDTEVVALAHEAARHASVAILSNNGLLVRDHLPALCPALSPLFDGRVLCSAEFGIGKPEAAIFAHASARLGLAPDAILFVDDKRANADAAQAAGMRAHHYCGAAGLRAALIDHGLLENGHAP